MTARRYPDEPVYGSPAEQLFVEALQENLPDDAVLFCGQRFSDRRQDREADVIVAWPGVGIAVVEVKGGSVSLREGEWHQVGGGLDKVIHPVDQARTCKYLLRDYLDRHPRWTAGNPRLVHLVALPATTLPQDFFAADLPRWMVLDKTDVPYAASRIEDALRRVVDQPEPPLPQDVDDLVDCLAGTAIPQQDLVADLAEREAACDLLTRDQADVLDRLVYLPRVEIRGGAGSGKTWLAVEKARRLAAEGKKVALMCYSRGLAEFLVRRVEHAATPRAPRLRGDVPQPRHRLGRPAGFGRRQRVLGGVPARRRWCRSRRRCPRPSGSTRSSSTRRRTSPRAGGPPSWPPCATPSTARLYVFADEGQRVFARQGRPTVDLVPIPLDENLRNTKQIAGTFSSLAPSQMRIRGQSGVPVRFVPCATEDAVEVADDEAVALLESGWPTDAVALLTTGSRHPVQAERQLAGQDVYWSSFWDDEDLFYGHVLGFKGLERPAVVLAVNGFRDEARAREMLYVGLSRARDLLVVCGDLELIRRVGGEAVARRLVGGSA